MNNTLNNMMDVLKEHDGHKVVVSGFTASAEKTVDVARTPEELGWTFLGYSVYCPGCKTSLSQQWNEG